ncbi:hypothetical protein EDC04DRAFT_2776472, partial [Pisolithus marmoratus]
CPFCPYQALLGIFPLCGFCPSLLLTRCLCCPPNQIQRVCAPPSPGSHQMGYSMSVCFGRPEFVLWMCDLGHIGDDQPLGAVRTSPALHQGPPAGRLQWNWRRRVHMWSG